MYIVLVKIVAYVKMFC